MRRLLGFSLLALSAALSHADTPAAVPARQLYDTGIRQTEDGKLAEARATLRSLVDSYPQDPLALQAKGAIDATLLFEEGQARVKACKYETARVAFETLIAVYPENPLARRAQSALEAIAEKEKASQPVVKSMEFRDVQAVPEEEIRAAMEAREVRLSVGKPCRSKDVAQAKAALAEILAEKGVGHVRVEARTRMIPPDSVAVVFTVEKSRASVVRSPWRLALAGWRRLRPVAVTPSAGL
jgi:outer membrane protein assembly factor BamD (BamD/ComL family)